MQDEYKVGSLFSGGGGIEIGFEKQGFKTIWFVEKELYPQAVLKKRFPGIRVYGDITTVDFRTVPKVDILTGGFPCQDISVAGKQVGITGSRSSLWKYYAKAIRILRPKFALIENVSALTIRGLEVILTDLAEIGYDAEWYNISASAVGAFHQRERIFIIAYPNSNRESDVSFNEGERQRIVDEISNSDDERQEGRGKDEIRFKELSDPKCLRPSEQRESRGPMYKKKSGDGKTSRFNDDGLWRAEPELGRVANGIPNRMDRIKCLGNAVVPQCAEVFAKAIKMKLSSPNLNSTNEVKDGKI